MKVISLINIKGGVAKTTSAIAIAQILASDYGKRVLVIDADQQANTTQTLGIENPAFTTADLLTSRDPIAEKAICPTQYGVDLIGASFALMSANKTVMLDSTRPQQFRFQKQLAPLKDKYDYCIIDCPPDISMSVINALAISDDVLVPIRADRYGFDGLSYVANAIAEMSEWNPSLSLAGSFLTMYQRGTNLSEFSKRALESLGVPVMKTVIRASVKVGESTFEKPIMSYAPKCTVADDYRALVAEYLNKEVARNG